MGLISEIVGESQMKKYQDKAYAFGVSPMFLYYKVILEILVWRWDVFSVCIIFTGMRHCLIV